MLTRHRMRTLWRRFGIDEAGLRDTMTWIINHVYIHTWYLILVPLSTFVRTAHCLRHPILNAFDRCAVSRYMSFQAFYSLIMYHRLISYVYLTSKYGTRYAVLVCANRWKHSRTCYHNYSPCCHCIVFVVLSLNYRRRQGDKPFHSNLLLRSHMHEHREPSCPLKIVRYA